MLRRVHVLGHCSLENDAIQELRVDSQKLMTQCEQYTTLLASLRLHAHAEKYFNIGVRLLALRDYFEGMKSLVGDTTSPTHAFRIHSTNLASILDRWFADERKRPDRAHKWEVWFRFFPVVASIPYALLHRSVIGPAMTLFGQNYRDPFSLEITRFLVEAAYQHAGRAVVFATLALTGPQLRALINKGNASDESVAALLRLRTLFDPDVWDGLLVQVITAELHRVNLNVVTADSLIADSTYVYVKAAFKPSEHIVMRLMLWHRTYDGMFGPGRPSSATG